MMVFFDQSFGFSSGFLFNKMLNSTDSLEHQPEAFINQG